MLHKDLSWSCTFQQMLQWGRRKNKLNYWDAVDTKTSAQSWVNKMTSCKIFTVYNTKSKPKKKKIQKKLYIGKIPFEMSAFQE